MRADWDELKKHWDAAVRQVTPWETVKRMVNLRLKGDSVGSIATAMGTSRQVVYKWLKRAGL